MAEEIVEAEVIGTDMVEAGTGVPASATLFRTDDPAEVLRRATEVANLLSDVLRKKNLVKRIGNREHVNVEGWTLCGSLLGVFAVTDWTRKLENPEGWEARVEAKMRDGAVVGAAEAECTRDEKMWGYDPRGRNGQKLEVRDDYALRSMAQTRAASKALRVPLGFIIELAGFNPTPAEEMPTDPEPQRRETDNRYPVPKSWVKIEEGIRQADNKDEAWALFQAFLRAASYHLFGETDQKKIGKEQRLVLLQKSASVVCDLNDHRVAEGGEFFFFDQDKQRAAWAKVLDGHALEIPDYEEPQPEGVDEEAEQIAREVFAEDAGNPYP